MHHTQRMLSYQHAYHAGHAADVAKHALLAALLVRLTDKPTPITYLETHAGRGVYPLDAPEMQKTREYETGLSRVLPYLAKAPAEARPYAQVVAALNPDALNVAAELHTVPGSPAVAKALLRPQDTVHLCEAHPGEVKHLRQAVKGDARIKVWAEDGHAKIPALLAQPATRSVVLIDPSYEVKTEYAQTAATAAKILENSPKTVQLLWYPLLPAGRHADLADGVAALNRPATWRAELTWNEPEEGTGMYGTGLIVLNLPWQFEDTAKALLHWLAPHLAGRHDERDEGYRLRTGFVHHPA